MNKKIRRRQRQLRVRGVQRETIDVRKLGKAVIALAAAKAEAEAEAEHRRKQKLQPEKQS